MKNITTTILLVLVSLLSYSQEYYRDTTIERAVFNEVNRHRDNLGLNKLKFNSDNKRAVPFGKKLVLEDLEFGGGLYHCECQGGIEVIALISVGDTDTIHMSVDEIAKRMVFVWNLSPSHKKGIEDKYMTRGFNSVYIFKSTRKNGKYVALSVFQLLRDKSHYINLDWDENEKVPNKFL
tara:strand:+ start:46 stop:582 length:537 start_codon:yes stop_codon:yes gene_type:complete